MLTEDEISKNRTEIIDLLKSTKRDGINNLITFLFDSDYFYLNGSFKHHLYKGGLAEHSLEVMRYALEHNKNCSKDSIIICALLHDICKTKYKFPEGLEFHGHGTKSAEIIDLFIKFSLTQEERNAIRFHMGKKCFIHDEEDAKQYKLAKKSELWRLIHVGDCLSAGNYPKSLHWIVGKIIRLVDIL